MFEEFREQLQAANIDQSPPRETSLKEMEDLKQHYLDEMKSLSNDLQIKDYRNEKIDIHFRRECEDIISELNSKSNGMSIEINKKKELQYFEQVAKLSTYTTEPSRHFNCTCCNDDDYEESTIPLNEIDSQTPSSIEITPVLPTLDPEDSLIMGNEELSTNPEKESNEFIKYSVEEIVPIPSEYEDTVESDSDCDLTFDDKSLSDEDVPEDVKIYSNPLFEFDDEYISSDVNPLFDEVLEDIESGDVDEIEFLLRRDPSTPKMSVVSILEGFTDEPPLEENDDLFDLESKANEWKKILYDAPIDDLMTEDKIAPNYEDSHARGFVHRSTQDTYKSLILSGESKVHIEVLSMLWGIGYRFLTARYRCLDFKKEAENDLTIEEKTELITELINYQKDFARIKKYQAQQQSESIKRSGILLEKVKAKRLKTSDVSAQEQQESDNQDEIINLQKWAVLVREETSVNITPSVVKVPICDWKIYKDKLREVYQIFRVGQAPKVYPYFESMLKDFDRDDLVTVRLREQYMSTSKTYQQSLAEAGSETRPPMLERGSYIPWASRFKRFLNRKRENRKWLLKALEDGPYVFRTITPTGSQLPRLQDVDDLEGDDLLYYDAEMELTNMILLSIPNEIYNSVDSCKTAKEMWDRVERLMRGTIQNQVDRETRFTNEFDQFVAEPGESLVSVYNRFAQLMNDLERNNMKFPTVSINTKFLNSLQPEWLKYVTQVRLAKKLTVDSFDDLFDYLSQFEKLVNASRSKKLEKSHDPLALVAHTGSSSRNTSSYYVTHPSSVVDYDEEYEQDDVHNHSEDPLASAMLLLAKAITQNFSNPTNNRLRASSNTRNQAVVQGDRVNIQSRNSGNVGRNNRRAYVQEEVVEGMNATNETANVQRIVRTPTPGNTSTGQCYNCGGKGHYARNCPKPRVRDSKYFMEQMLLAKQDEAGVILTDEQNDFLFADASRMEEIEELSANICLMARIQPADQNSDDEPSYESAFVSEVQSSSINENDEQMYPTHTKIINSTIDDDQINSNIQFDSVKGNVNSGSVEKDTHVYDQCALETLARNAYDEAAKQQRFAQKVQQQNMTLTSQIEMYKERNRVLENITKDNNYLKEFLEADERAKRVQKQAESQLYRDRDIIRDLEKQRDKLSQEVKHFKQKNEELQQSHLILKRKMSENEDKYHDTILDLEEKLKKNVDLFLKIGNSLQAMFMLGPKPLSVYDQQLKHGLGYPNPYTLRQAISECPKLYVASRTGNIEIPLNVRDSEETLEDAFKSQQKMNEKMNDPIAVANKQNCWTIDYKQLNALYNDFVPQKESFVEQTCSSSSYIPFVKILETKTMPSELPLINELFNIKVGFEKLFLLIKQNSKRASMFYTSKEEIALNDFCRDQVKPLLNELLDYFDGFQNLFQRDIKEMKDAFEQNDVKMPTPKTRFFEKATQSKTLDTTSVASKSKIDEASASKARDKVSSEIKRKKRNMYDKPLSPFMLNKIRTSSLWQKWFESQSNVVWAPVNTKPHVHTNPSNTKPLVVQIILWIVDSGCSKHMTGDRSLLRNFVEKFMGTVRFGNDNFATITGYGDCTHGNITICHVYYVEGLGHNLFSVGQFCDGDLEVAFRSKTCYVDKLEGDIAHKATKAERDSNLYTNLNLDMAASSPILGLMTKRNLNKVMVIGIED
ncbi:retrovirus-related pol polyprotein from transposon TNT 1-94 [Tanacetum coccineum]